MGSRSWWTRLRCLLFGHAWRLGWSEASPLIRARWCTRADCGASQVRDVPAGEKWHTPTLEEQGLR
jgi:hypothetical protein